MASLIFGAGVGLIGSGLFVTDPVAGFPPTTDATENGAPEGATSSRGGTLHNLCAIPIFAGIPTAALTDAGWAMLRRDYRWACYSAGSAVGMIAAFMLFGAAFSGRPRARLHRSSKMPWFVVLGVT